MKMKTSVLLLCGILEKAETGKPVMIYTYGFEGKKHGKPVTLVSLLASRLAYINKFDYSLDYSLS